MPDQPFVASSRLYLRDVRPEDADGAYQAWMNDIEVTRYLESRFFPHSREGLRRFVESRQGASHEAFFAIVKADGDRHIGNIKLGPIDWVHRLGEIGLMLGDKASWGQGYATEAIGLVKAYAFERLNLRRLTAGCYAPNVGSLRAFEKAGFAVEGVRPRHFYCEGDYVDYVLLGCHREDAE